jgi:KaiC/GvpD/RAD55 family RecA-like ATPase
MVKRVPTGIYGLDELIQGGFPQGRTILVSGGCGTGKSIFCLQFLYKGATDYGEPGVYVTLDERADLIREDMGNFSWDFQALEDQGMLVILDLTGIKIGLSPASKEYAGTSGKTIDIDRLILKIMQVASSIGAKRVAIDSLPALGLHMENEIDMRNIILKVNYMLRKSGLTAVVTSEIPEQSLGGGPMQFSKYGVEEYVADGVILLHYLGIGTESNRTLYIRKMRSTKHVEDIIPMEITDAGIKLTSPDEAFNI